ncbi:MAG: hypothetical protein DRI71_06650 [Bacteroidetes bacterium]|nr:MAG: hypothetical protein DRI71_06650 [Bacteroidota bacterium]
MLYDLNTPIGISQYQSRSKYLLEKKCKVDLTEKRSKKTINQNNYIHLIMAYFGTQIGFNKREVEQLVKKLNHDMFHYEKKGLDLYRSLADLDTSEMSKVIDKFIKYAQDEVGVSIPDPTDAPYLDQCQNQIESSQSFV